MRTSDWRIWTVVALISVEIILAVVMANVASARALTSLEGVLVGIFQWTGAVVVGVLATAMYADVSRAKELEARARPAVRRVAGLLNSAERMRRFDASDGEKINGMRLAVDFQVDQLKAAVHDWKDLLPPDYVDSIVDEESEGATGRRLTWAEFDKAIEELSLLLTKSDHRGGFRPDVLVGKYPEGGLVAYLLWQRIGGALPIVLCPTANLGVSRAEALELYSSSLKYATRSVNDERPTKALVVDASLKSGASLDWILSLTASAADTIGRQIVAKSMVVVDYPVDGERIVQPDYSYTRKAVDLPFADS